MTGKERITRILNRQPVDRIGLYEHFWGDTKREWAKKGFIDEDIDFGEHFGFDIMACWALNFVADLDFEDEILEETEDTIVKRDGNGAVLRHHKFHDTTPEHIDFLVKNKADWEKHIKPKLKVDRRRINFEEYRRVRKLAKEQDKYFVLSGVNVFELMHPICGHEHMLVGMALEPEWILDMVNTLSDMIVEMQKILFEEEGYPDGVWYYEDMGFKERPFMSPKMYKELVWPGHKKTVGFNKSLGLQVIMHSCGFVEPLIPGMLEAGIDCLQVIEVKAGMDLVRIYETYKDRLSLMGGIDVRTLYSNDRDIITKELESKIPIVMQNNGFVLHSDHSIPNTVDYDTYKFFIEKGLELGTYK